jgi:putative SOS response-associated peptidase YedK
MWRDAYRSGQGHCAIVASSWFEWRRQEHLDPISGEIKPYKQPYNLHRANHEVFCFAGLLSLWLPPAPAEPVLTCAILTRAAVDSVSAVHERMPVVLPDAFVEAWLDPALQGAPAAAEILAQAENDFRYYAVSTQVNNARNEGPQLVEALRAA